MSRQSPTQDNLYQEVAETYGPAMERLARAYEADPELRRDLLQDIHIALWRIFAGFNGICSLRTWVYRVAHNVATSHVILQRRAKSVTLVGIEELETMPDKSAGVLAADRRDLLARLLELIQQLKPLDRQVMLSYLEGLDAASIGNITGVSAVNVATKIHRSVDDLRRKAGKFRKRIFWRNAREYVAALGVIVFFGYQLAHTTDADTLVRVAFGLMIAGVLYMVWHLHRRGSSRSLPEEMGLANSLEFYRRELARQRDLVQSVGKWYFGPLIPGWVLLEVAFARANPGHPRHFALFFTMFNLLVAAVFVFVWKLNQRAARRVQRQIDELDALQKQQ
jgi:RNA polymerase sigma-70 factor, ECF subfamily